MFTCMCVSTAVHRHRKSNITVTHHDVVVVKTKETFMVHYRCEHRMEFTEEA